jgi:hypothetical protein
LAPPTTGCRRRTPPAPTRIQLGWQCEHDMVLGVLVLTSKQSWCKVPGRVDGIATVKAKTDSNAEDSEADEERDHLLGDLEQCVMMILIILMMILSRGQPACSDCP